MGFFSGTARRQTSPQSVLQFFLCWVKRIPKLTGLTNVLTHACLSVVFISHGVVNSTMQHNNAGHPQSEDSDPLAASGSGLCGTVRFHIADGLVRFELTL